MPNPTGTPENLKHFRPKWRSGATQTVRLPVAIIDQVLRYAQDLDRGEAIKASTPSYDNESLLQVIQMLNEVHETPRNNFSREKKALLKVAIDKLQSLVTSDIVTS